MVIDWPEDDEMGDDEISSEGNVLLIQPSLSQSVVPLLIFYIEDIASEDEMDSDLDADDDDDVIS